MNSLPSQYHLIPFNGGWLGKDEERITKFHPNFYEEIKKNVLIQHEITTLREQINVLKQSDTSSSPAMRSDSQPPYTPDGKIIVKYLIKYIKPLH